MSDDIRVYWSEELEEYLMSIGYEFYFLENEQHDSTDLHWWSSRIGWLVPDCFELVYDSAEHEDYSLIDENLVVPDVANNAVIEVEALRWHKHDLDIWVDGYRRHLVEHEERTA